MDPPILLKHKNHHPQQKPRYVSVPHSSRPHYTDDVNFYKPSDQHRHHRIPRHQAQFQSPPPPPPPRSQTPFQPPPPPQSSYHPPQKHPYDPGQFQLTFANPYQGRPSFEDHFPRSSYHHRDSVVSRQLAFQDDRPRHRLLDFEQEIRQELWKQPRVLAKVLPDRTHKPLDFGRGSHKFKLDHKPMSPYIMDSKLRHASVCISSIKSKHRDELLRGADEDTYSRRGSFLSSPGTFFRDIGLASDPRYGSTFNSELHRSSGRDGVYHDNQRRVHDRIFLRESYISSFEKVNPEVSNGDGACIGSVIREYHGPELGRYSSRGRSGNSHEFNPTSRKQLHKKSDLLRLQIRTPNHRNVESEPLHYAGYQDNSNSSSFRRKYHFLYEEEREGSPVELDVSFKSNSLVAKAIVVPLSSSDVNCADSISGDMKFRKDSLSDRRCLNSELSKLGDNTANVVVSMHVGNSKSSYEGMTQSEGVVFLGVKNTCNTSTQACLSRTEVKRSFECTEINIEDDTKVGLDNVPLKVPKNKKVVRRMIKKVVGLCPHVNSLQKKKPDELVKADACVPTPSEAFVNYKGVAFSCPCSNENRMVHEGKKEVFAASMESEEHGIDVNSSMECINNTGKFGNSFEAFTGSTSSEENMFDKGQKYSVQGLPTISTSDNNSFRSLCVSASIPEIAHVVNIKESHPSEESLLFDSGLEMDSSPVTLPIGTLPIGGNGDSALLNAGGIIMHDNPMNTSCCTSSTLDTVSGLTLSKEEIRVCDVGTKGALSKLPNRILVTTLHDSSVQEEVSNAIWSAESSAKVGLSALEKTAMDVDSLHLDETTSLNDTIRNCEENVTISSSCTVDHMQSSTRGAMKSFPNTKISFGDNKGDKPLIRKKRSVRSQLDFSNITDTALDAVNVSNAINAVSTMLSLSFDNQNNEGVVSTPHCRKKRKVVGFHLVMDLPTSATDEQPSSASCAESITSNEVSMQQYTYLNKSIADTTSAATNLMHCECGITELSEGSSNTVVAVRSFSNDDTLKSENQLGCGPILEKSSIPTMGSLCSEGSRHRQKNVDAAVMVASDQHGEAFNIESIGREVLGVSASKEKVNAQEETSQYIPSDVLVLDIDHRLSLTGMEFDNLLVKDEFPSLSNYLSLPIDQSRVSITTSSEEAVEFVPDTLKNVVSHQSSHTVSNVHKLDATSGSQISNKTWEDGNLVKVIVDIDGSNVTDEKSLSQYTDVNLKSNCATEIDQAIEKPIALPLQDSRSLPEGVNINGADYYNGDKNLLGHATPRTFSGRTSFAFTNVKTKGTSYHANPQTWHRNIVFPASPPGTKLFTRTAPQTQLSERDGKIRCTSYVRKGNSLIRKPSLAAALPLVNSGFSPVYWLNSPGLDELKRSIERVGAGMSNHSLRKGEMKPSCEKSRTSLVLSGTLLPNISLSSWDCTSSPLAGSHLNDCFETTLDPISSTENGHITKFVKDLLTSENQNGLLTSLDNQSQLDDGNSDHVNTKRIVIQASSFDGYFKRGKNQLIRTSQEIHIKQPLVMPDDNLGIQITLKAISSSRFRKRHSQKVAKMFKRSSNSLVWTLCNSQSSKNDSDTISHQKLYPHLFPWKRTTYWRNLMQNWNSLSKNNSIANSGNRLLSRKQDTVYTRSINGFSLRKSKVTSVGVSSLKWSKSIDRHSKKANEEATLAVVAVERKKREQKRSTRNIFGSNDRYHSSRERIFCVGSCRYKMDPSRQTLKRISDDESSSFAATIYPDAKRCYKLRKLVIGNNEYVQIGNGNQLVRDPKKRTRILASEKVRWSLHTARFRLAKRRMYCQFFSRFGKCNKDNGRCHFIHDSSKIAVCTKFLNGLCSNANCKLTHKVIPERMPVCSYFLQGLCTNQICPYRHINVNPKASTCEGFLRGYCADGNECRKKHSYICPIFEATGICLQKSKCKLHHPKNQLQERKRKRSREVRNDRGRYFGAQDLCLSKSRKVGFEKSFAQDYNNVIVNENLTDFIAIDVAGDDAEESNDSTSEQTTFCDSDTLDLELGDFEELLIKPVRLMD